jgi:hypothetical protein
LRSYIEIDSQIILEGNVNNLLRQSHITKYKDKKILFQRGISFQDINALLGNLDIQDRRDLDIITRIYDYALIISGNG